MEFELDGGGKVNFNISQRRWFGNSPNIMQVVRFAG